MSRIGVSSGWALVLVLASVEQLAAQQVTVRTPMIGVQDGFYEHFNVGWGFRSRSPRGGMFFSFGGPALPPFGGYDPNADARFGFAQRWGNGDLFFNFTAGAGRRSTMTMTAPSVTMMNGVPGSIRDVTLRPFVVGLVPVVGDYPLYPMLPTYSAAPPVLISPLAGRLERLEFEQSHGRAPQASVEEERVDAGEGEMPAPAITPSSHTSTAERGDVSVAEIRREQAARQSAKQREVQQLIEEAQVAQRSGQLAIARVRYKQAAAKADGEQRRQLLELAQRLKDE